jgi:hypothetical protein
MRGILVFVQSDDLVGENVRIELIDVKKTGDREWREVVVYTQFEIERRALVEMSLPSDRFEAIGESIAARLVAFMSK